MLQEGRARRRSGVDTVIAHWERHGRPGRRLSSTISRYFLRERSPTAARALRSWTSRDSGPPPAAGFVDELAHANLPGERHARRWQEVGELLAGGIDVYTTLNVANIESLVPVVSRITGVRRPSQYR